MKHKLGKYIISFVIFIILGALTCVAFSLKNDTDIPQIKVSESGKLDYQVCLKNNDSSEECIQDKNINSNYIDKIKFNFNYTLNASEGINYKYGYEIKVDEVATNKLEDNKEEFVKNDVIDTAGSNGAGGLIKVNKDFEIDYADLKDALLKYRDANMLDLDGTITVTVRFRIELNKETYSDIISKDHKLKVKIPLVDDNITIEENNLNIKEYNVILKNHELTEKQKRINYIKLGAYIVDTIYLAFIIIMFMIVLPNKKK